jgi:hypothetical protein
MVRQNAEILGEESGKRADNFPVQLFRRDFAYEGFSPQQTNRLTGEIANAP